MATGRRRKRSPRHPSFALPRAIEYAEKIRKEATFQPHSAEVMAVALGASARSSGGRQKLATLRQFGLLEPIRQQGKPMLMLSRLARRVLMLKKDTPERAQAVREAALTPELHFKLIELYGTDGLPGDETLGFVLVDRFGFGERAASAFISQFRDTLQFASIHVGSESVPEEQEAVPEVAPEGASMRIAPMADPTVETGPGTAEIRIPFSGGRWMTVRGPIGLSAAEWQRLLTGLDFNKLAFMPEAATEADKAGEVGDEN